MSLNLNVNVRVSVSAHFLRKTRAVELLRGRFDFNAPRLRLNGITTAKSTDAKNKVLYNVVFDELPDTTFVLYGTSLKHEGPIVRQETIVNHSNTATTVSNTNTQKEDGNLEDAEPSDEDEEEEGITVCDEVWDTREVYVDARLVSGNDYRSMKSKFNLQNKATASPAEYFLYFLPMDHIREVVVPNINTHAHSVNNRWIILTFLEYLTWVAILMNMTVVIS
ncbi:hypothetical protein INT47_001300 [Mucor saturninus]|uniref:Uncharacterized protein n=1 Tax=Mucor saturninus TaxID=64648 RepID=A0A8H7UNT2_9FUNG|nr:hypothetical protein INT47_001300 [Mucor saturninus]